MIRRVWMAFAALVLAAIFAVSPAFLNASDHDDGETDVKGRNLNLTDLYLFREVDQNVAVGPQCMSATASCDLIFIMNVNPRSVARQQYYFSTRAWYEFKVTRAASNSATPTGKADVILRFQFSAPDANRRQQITITALKDGTEVAASAGSTTALNDTPIINNLGLGGFTLSIFAGLREDPFFFDVEQFFRVRAGALDIGPPVGFRNPGVDFTLGYNVLSIVVRVPRTLLQGSTSATTFDAWETISVPGAGSIPGAATMNQVERLARPAINEGLLNTNDLLNAMNAIGPDDEAAALAGKKPQARVAAPILAEAANLLARLGNSSARIGQLVAAFLPDVMRIDTTQPSGYAAGFTGLNGPATLKRGRMITDDVIDDTLLVLTNGAVMSDNVSYSPGHHPLLPVGFPYLPAPN